ncbi:hypothetical protein [Pararhizobium sp.]|uniref:hypothetical protein n=1 Tax=Pararhizobium sp. TaxID=1977563 RepID=UPI0027237F14|nr:hypothetical protein [Pararhizobium sp.]MDO9415668.1 hypothetical protein [Pararhizobium sp.]
MSEIAEGRSVDSGNKRGLSFRIAEIFDPRAKGNVTALRPVAFDVVSSHDFSVAQKLHTWQIKLPVSRFAVYADQRSPAINHASRLMLHYRWTL